MSGGMRKGEQASTTIIAKPLPEIVLPETIQFRRILLILAQWKAERDAECEHCKKGLDLGRHGCHFEDDGEESFTVGNCKAWPLSRRIQQIEEAMKP